MEENPWFWAKGYWKFYITNPKDKQRIERWQEAKLHCEYFYANGNTAWDFIVPSKLHNRVAKLLGLPLLAKNKNRVEAGKRLKGLIFPYKFTGVKLTKTCRRAVKKAKSVSIYRSIIGRSKKAYFKN